MKKIGFIFSSLAAALILSGCSLTPEYMRPDVKTPAWQTDYKSDENLQISQLWWKNYNSPELSRLIEKALANNNDLQAALYRIEQARGGLQIAGADLLPSASATAAYMSGSTIPMNITDMRNNGIPKYTANAGISYELDLFGANQAKKASAAFSLQGTEYAYDAMTLVLIGDVAQTYFNVLRLQERYELAEKNIDLAEDSLKLITARFQTGSLTSYDMTQQETILANRRAVILALENEINIAKSALALLVGEPPQSFQVNVGRLEHIKVPEVPVLQPADLLERRPDIKNIEAQLMAANADIGAARATFYPDINLGTNLIAVFDPAATALILASSVYAPIFQGGKLKGNLNKITARQKELVEKYQQTVLKAFKESTDSMSGLAIAQRKKKAFWQAVEKSRQSYKIANQQYDVSVIDFQNVLEAERAVILAQDNYINAQYETLTASIELFKAMGGGWAANERNGDFRDER